MMRIQRLSRLSLLLGSVLAGSALALTAQTINFDGSVSRGTTIKVTGTIVGTVSVSVYKFPAAAANCGSADILNRSAKLLPLVPDASTPSITAPQMSIDPSSKTPITLATPVNTGDNLCLVAFSAGDPDKPIYSSIAPVAAAAVAAPGIGFGDTPVAGDDTIWVKGTVGHNITVLLFPAGYKPLSKSKDAGGATPCISTDLQAGPQELAFKSAGAGAPATSMPLTTATQAIQLQNPLASGSQLCIDDTTQPELSYFAKVQDPKTGQPVLQFTSELVTGNSTFSVQGPVKDESVSVYLFGAGYLPYGGEKLACKDSDRAHGTPLTVSTSGKAAGDGTLTISDANTPVPVTLTNPLAAGTWICLFGAKGAGSANDEVSYFKRVQYFAPGDDYGRFRIDLTGGVMISNEQQSGSSSTASQYFDLGLSYTLARAGSEQKPDEGNEPKPSLFSERGPGMASLMDIRLTAVPVAAKTSSTTIAATPTTLSQSLNVLSSQQSATVLMGFYFPFRLTHWYGRTNWITFAPVAFGGFDTLLNPTATTATSANAGAVTSATTTNFSSVYNFRAGGARFAWDIYPRRTDEAPIEISWVNLTLGYYSNLPSWRCTAPAAPPGSNPTSGPTGKTYVPSPNNNTSCLAVGVVPPGSTGTSPSSYHLYESRTLVPRVGIAGELKLPNYPVVFGYIANLSQYGKFTGGNGIDSQNKPGNDVRFYFGLKVNAKDALKKLGVPSS